MAAQILMFAYSVLTFVTLGAIAWMMHKAGWDFIAGFGLMLALGQLAYYSKHGEWFT